MHARRLFADLGVDVRGTQRVPAQEVVTGELVLHAHAFQCGIAPVAQPGRIAAAVVVQLAVAGEPGTADGDVERHADIRLEAGDIQPPGVQLQVGAQGRKPQLAGGGERAPPADAALQLEGTGFAQLVAQLVDATLE